MIDVLYEPGWTSAFVWTIWVGFLVAFLLGFGMGANDCANSYGTVVGAGVLKLWQAYLFATVFETLGALLLGYRVMETIRNGIVDVEIYNVSSQYNASANAYVNVDSCPAIDPVQTNCSDYTSAELLLGELGTLTGTAFWLIVASIFKMPVSATQSVVGATIGYSLVLRGTQGIRWKELIGIVASWVTSPLMAGTISSVFYMLIKAVVFRARDQLTASLHLLPGLLWFALAVNLFSVFYHGSKYLGLDETPWWLALLISNTIGAVVAVFMFAIGNKYVRKRAIAMGDTSLAHHHHHHHAGPPDMIKMGRKHYSYDLPPNTISSLPASKWGPTEHYRSNLDDALEKNNSLSTTVQFSAHENGFAHTNKNGSVENEVATNENRERAGFWKEIFKPMYEDPFAVNVFNYLQILSASFLAFSHGSNDTANSVGPLAGLWGTYRHGTAVFAVEKDADMEYILMFGAVSMLIGLYVMGHRVIATIGKDLTDINAPSGFSMTMGTAFTVLFASKVGIPVSTTHCMVGAVVLVGLCRSASLQGVSWRLFGGIAFAWLVTTPVSAAVSALVTYLLVHFILGTV